MAPIVCLTTLLASLYDVCPLLDSLDNIFETTPPATTTGGMHDNITRDRSQPFTNATMSGDTVIVQDAIGEKVITLQQVK